MSWLWRALRGRSITFAVLFALGVLGISILSEFRHLLSRLGAPWYAWLIVPIMIVAVLARKETEWVPDVEKRRKWARWLVFGSIVIALLMAKLRDEPAKPQSEPGKPRVQEPQGRARVQGR